MIILEHHCVTVLLAKILIWAPFSQSMCAFSFCINPRVCVLFIYTISMSVSQEEISLKDMTQSTDMTFK